MAGVHWSRSCHSVTLLAVFLPHPMCPLLPLTVVSPHSQAANKHSKSEAYSDPHSEIIHSHTQARADSHANPDPHSHIFTFLYHQDCPLLEPISPHTSTIATHIVTTRLQVYQTIRNQLARFPLTVGC